MRCVSLHRDPQGDVNTLLASGTTDLQHRLHFRLVLLCGLFYSTSTLALNRRNEEFSNDSPLLLDLVMALYRSVMVASSY